MRYIDVKWMHDSGSEPIRLVSEIGSDGYETRKLEFFPDETVGFADSNRHTDRTRLGEAEVPPLAEINAQEEFVGIGISRDEFELLWRKHVTDNS